MKLWAKQNVVTDLTSIKIKLKTKIVTVQEIAEQWQPQEESRRVSQEYPSESLQRPDWHMALPDLSLLAEGGKLSSSTQPEAQPAVSHPFWTTTNTLI